jgi:DNA-binding PadR family transcriptional regulator
MTNLKQLFEIVESVAATRPSYSLPNFLPRQVLELGVLDLLENSDYAGFDLIRELAPLSRRAYSYGVNYPLLHQMEAEGTIKAYQPDSTPRRMYSLTDTGRARLERLRLEYDGNTPERYQIGISLIQAQTMHVGAVAASAN